MEKAARKVKYCETCGLVRQGHLHGEKTCKCNFIELVWNRQKIAHKPARKFQRKNNVS